MTSDYFKIEEALKKLFEDYNRDMARAINPLVDRCEACNRIGVIAENNTNLLCVDCANLDAEPTSGECPVCGVNCDYNAYGTCAFCAEPYETNIVQIKAFDFLDEANAFLQTIHASRVRNVLDAPTYYAVVYETTWKVYRDTFKQHAAKHGIELPVIDQSA